MNVPIFIAGWRGEYIASELPPSESLPRPAPRPKRTRTRAQRNTLMLACPNCFHVFYGRKGQRACSWACSSKLRSK